MHIFSTLDAFFDTRKINPRTNTIGKEIAGNNLIFQIGISRLRSHFATSKREVKVKGLIPVERIENKIYLIRGQKVMLDFDLAKLYQVSTGRLNEQVKRNRNRFPSDFMFSLTRQEILSISQFAISSAVKFSKNCNAFTEQGIAMLSSVLKSDRAILVNVAIMWTFVKIRQMISSNKELSHRLDELERKIAQRLDKHDAEILLMFETIRKLMDPPAPKPKKIGFIVNSARREAQQNSRKK